MKHFASCVLQRDTLREFIFLIILFCFYLVTLSLTQYKYKVNSCNHLSNRAAVSELEKGLELVKTVKMYDIAIKILRLFVANQKLPVNAAFAKLKDILVQGQSQDLLSEDSYLIWVRYCS